MRFADSWKDIIELIVISVTAFIALVQLELLRRQLSDQRKLAEDENTKERRRRTLEADARLADHSSEDARVNRHFPREEFRTPIPLATIKEAFKSDSDLKQSVDAMLTQFEILSLPVCASVADEDMAFELIGVTLIWYATAFKLYIDDRRVSENRKDLYVYMEYLCMRWASRLGHNGYVQLYTLPESHSVSTKR